MNARWVYTFACLVAWLVSAEGRAESIRVDFAGTVVDVRDTSHLPGPPPPIGERFSGWFAYESENLLTLLDEDDEPYGRLAGATLNLSFGGVSWSIPSIRVYDDVFYDDDCGGPCDIWDLAVVGPDLRRAAVVLEDPTQTVVSGNDPFVPMSLDDWTRGRLTLTQLVFDTNQRQFYTEFEFRGVIDTWQVTVPEPEGLASFAVIAVIGLNFAAVACLPHCGSRRRGPSLARAPSASAASAG